MMGGQKGPLLVLVLAAAALALPSHEAVRVWQPGNPASCPLVAESDRVDCFPEGYQSLSEQACNQRGCCWNQTVGANGGVSDGIPFCFYPAQFGYKLDTVTPSDAGIVGSLSLLNQYTGPYGPNIPQLKFEATYISNNIVRLKISDAQAARYEVPIAVPQTTIDRGDPADDAFSVSYRQAPEAFGFAVHRRATATSVFDSLGFGGLVFEDQFLQLSTRASSTNAYGLGEHVAPLLLDFNWKTVTMFARDQGTPTGYTNLYGTHPLMLFIEPDGNVSGIFFFNSNAMDIVLQPSPGVTFRSIGGVLDFFIFLGPTVDAVLEQYTAVVGRPHMPPYWSLGFHLCRWGYNSLNRTAQIVHAMRAAGIPQDTQWNDIDYMQNHLDFTYDPEAFAGLPDFVDDLHAHHQHYVMIVDPGISNAQPPGSYPPFDQGLSQGIFIKNASGQPLIGSVWPGTTAFPDFLNPSARAYWRDQIAAFQSKVAFDGLWIDMNEISNFVPGSTSGCPQSSLETPPYVPHVADSSLHAKTICMTATHAGGLREYDVHSLYGYTEMIATRAALESVRGKRSFVISRSTFPNAGAQGGHWLGDNTSLWADLVASIAGILNFNLFGIPMIGADICGFNGSPNAELCARWMQLGAFYPFSRNHNAIGKADQDPTSLGQQVLEISREVLLLRYSLLPFLYSLFYRAHVTGAPVARPLFADFPTDPSTYAIDRQFTWGGALLITPVLTQGAVSVQGYFPRGQWYNFITGAPVAGPARGRFVLLPAPLNTINVHLRGGSIVPTQAPATTTFAARQNAMGLVVALQDGAAAGFQFTDDGDSLSSLDEGKYTLTWYNVTTLSGVGTLKSTVMQAGYSDDPAISVLRVLGLSSCPRRVAVDGQGSDFTCDPNTTMLTVSNFKVYVSSSFTIQWFL